MVAFKKQVPFLFTCVAINLLQAHKAEFDNTGPHSSGVYGDKQFKSGDYYGQREFLREREYSDTIAHDYKEYRFASRSRLEDAVKNKALSADLNDPVVDKGHFSLPDSQVPDISEDRWTEKAYRGRGYVTQMDLVNRVEYIPHPIYEHLEAMFVNQDLYDISDWREQYDVFLRLRSYAARVVKPFRYEGEYDFYSRVDDKFSWLRPYSSRPHRVMRYFNNTLKASATSAALIQNTAIKQYAAPLAYTGKLPLPAEKCFGLSLGSWQKNKILLSELYEADSRSQAIGSYIYSYDGKSFVRQGGPIGLDKEHYADKYRMLMTAVEDDYDKLWHSDDGGWHSQEDGFYAALTDDHQDEDMRYHGEEAFLDLRKWGAIGPDGKFFVVASTGGLMSNLKPLLGKLDSKKNDFGNSNNLLERRYAAYDVAVGKEFVATIFVDCNYDQQYGDNKTSIITPVAVAALKDISAQGLADMDVRMSRWNHATGRSTDEKVQAVFTSQQDLQFHLYQLIDFDQHDNLILLSQDLQGRSWLHVATGLNGDNVKTFKKMLKIKATHMSAGKGIMIRDHSDHLFYLDYDVIKNGKFLKSSQLANAQPLEANWNQLNVLNESESDFKVTDFSLDNEGYLAVNVGDGELYILSAQEYFGEFLPEFNSGDKVRVKLNKKWLSLRENYEKNDDLMLALTSSNKDFTSVFELQKHELFVAFKADNGKWIGIDEQGFLEAEVSGDAPPAEALFRAAMVQGRWCLRSEKTKLWLKKVPLGIQCIAEEVAEADGIEVVEAQDLRSWQQFNQDLRRVDVKDKNRKDVEFIAYAKAVFGDTSQARISSTGAASRKITTSGLTPSQAVKRAAASIW